MRTIPKHVALIFGLLFFLSQSSSAQDDEEDPYLPGLIATYREPNGPTANRIDQTVSFAWHDRSPDRRLPAGKFSADWRGYLVSQANGAYQLHAFCAGKLRIRLNEKVVIDGDANEARWFSSEPLELSYAYHPLQIEYTSAPKNARLSLYWSGPQFQLEPVDGRQLFHERNQTIPPTFSRGEELVRALRCAACHQIPTESPAIAAPALDRLATAIEPNWIVDWLSAPHDSQAADPSLLRRMPHFQLAGEDARAIAAFLIRKSLPIERKSRPDARADTPSNRDSKKQSAAKDAKIKKKKGDDEPVPPPKTPVESGRELVMTLGCLACHRVGELGHSDLFGGGDLSAIAAKRPANFFELWLAEPESLNAQHRMPVFELTKEERRDISVYLATLRTTQFTTDSKDLAANEDFVRKGERLFAEHRCAACHTGPVKPPLSIINKSRIGSASKWDRACTGAQVKEHQPRYALSDRDREAIREYVTKLNAGSEFVRTTGTFLRERGCVACHWRDNSPGLAPWLSAVAEKIPDLASQLPAMTPPPLISVGDKLNEQALEDAIRRKGTTLRPYLRVRMPKFAIRDEELKSLIDEMVTADRIPAGAPQTSITNTEPAPANSANASHASVALDAVGTRLVTPDGFGCTSCHQVGSVLPSKAPLNARGADLTMLGRRIRKEWFDRWVRNPSRIIPRMEMPSVQVAVRGVMNENLDTQLNAVWDVLNRPGFEPPEPNPVRIVRQTGTKPDARAVWISDVLRNKSTSYVKPLLIGLANRHNVLFDLETARIAVWTMGDVARQRTEGKTWYWELAGKELLQRPSRLSDLSLLVDGHEYDPVVTGQFPTEFDFVHQAENQFTFGYRLRFKIGAQVSQVAIKETIETVPNLNGFRRKIQARGIPHGARLRPRIVTDDQNPKLVFGDILRIIQIRGTDNAGVAIYLNGDFDFDGQPAQPTEMITFEFDYSTNLQVDQFPIESPLAVPAAPSMLNVVPGFAATRLPLSDEIMPTALAWRPDGTLVIASLKGQVWLVQDQNKDGLADQLQAFSDDLAAPYGLHATNEFIDVVNKYALLRLFDDDGDGRADRTVTVASGWGHTADYHDWAVGLPRDEQGNYYVALPCQQDERSQAAANLRSDFLRLVPRQPTEDDPRLYKIETISRGHRFPMGIARNRAGDFFVTDNQGNYNPFNELNQIRQGAHFGFINALEKANKDRPPLTPPAIDIPHPWTRSVNGICFLDSPVEKSTFGPWEGHLIGCEYDTRRLIRMTLQKVGDTYQGAAYPFSYDQPPSGPPLLGPIVCSVSPDGDLYVGGLRDSGWGGANNIGEIVRLHFDPASQPNGLVEMSATATGFELQFVKPVAESAANSENYALASYTRESTPAYGGPDVDRRTENISRVVLSEDRRHVTLELKELRAGYVYELHVKKLVAAGEAFFPAEAHYTLRVIPPSPFAPS